MVMGEFHSRFYSRFAPNLTPDRQSNLIHFKVYFGHGFGHGSVPVLATMPGISPSQLVPMDLSLSDCSVSLKYHSVVVDRWQSPECFLRLWSWLPRFDS